MNDTQRFNKAIKDLQAKLTKSENRYKGLLVRFTKLEKAVVDYIAEDVEMFNKARGE